MKYLIFVLCITVTGMLFASDADLSPVLGTYGSADAALTQLDYFDMEALGASNRCVGVGFDGTNFWVTDGVESSGSGVNTIWIVTGVAPHTVVTSFEQILTSSWGLRDLCWDGTYMYGSESNQVDYYDASYAKAGEYTCNAISPNRAQAWDGTYFYTGSFSTEIYQVTWDGVSGSSATFTTWSTAVANGGTYGAAWDDINNCLWVTTASSDGMLYQIDNAGALITSYNLNPEAPTCGGCCMANYGTDSDELWTLAQDTPDGVYCWNTSTLDLQRTSWGAIKTIF